MKRNVDTTNLGVLYSKYYERFIRFAKSYVIREDVAEDIVTDSFIYYWENHDKLSDESNIPVYILTTVKHKCLNYLKQLQLRKKIKEHLAQMEDWELNVHISTLEASEPKKLFSKEIQQIVAETLQSLPKQTREIFIQSRFQNQNHKEIAARMGLSTKSIEYHITKVLKILRIKLKDYFVFFSLI